MHLHIRKAANANALVVTLRESYRQGGKVRHRQHHAGSCPIGIDMNTANDYTDNDDPRSRRLRHHVHWFWMRFDETCDELEVSATAKREYERRIRAAGVPRRRPRKDTR